MEYDEFGIAFVSDSVRNKEIVEDELINKEQELLCDAIEKLEMWLESKGLENVMGIIYKKE